MRILVISEPVGSFADLLLKSGIRSLICVTPKNVHLRSRMGVAVSGKEIKCPKKIQINVPEIKKELVKAYPLIDRWVDKNQSISTTIALMLEYTTNLVQIIGNYPPRVAVLETGAPHHLFTYCLDVALNYLNVKVYYLYGNAYDGRCIVSEGNEKKGVVRVSDYSARDAVNKYMADVHRAVSYTPLYTTKAISNFRHKSQYIAVYLRARHLVGALFRQAKKARSISHGSEINLRLPQINFFHGLQILNAQAGYLKKLKHHVDFKSSIIEPSDIVYVGHMVPEATSCPESPDYPDELDVLIDLKSRFPESQIYYREHPAIEIFSQNGDVHFQGLHKCPAFYKQLGDLGIGIVPPWIHISGIRDRCCLFATKTGSVAVENSVLGIPTIVYGHPFYGSDLPLTFHISKIPSSSTVESIKTLAASILDPETAVKEYLIAMFSGSIENPAMGLDVPNPSVRPAFEISLLRLVNHLCIENEPLSDLGKK